jgi:hypothetical protein
MHRQISLSQSTGSTFQLREEASLLGPVDPGCVCA